MTMITLFLLACVLSSLQLWLRVCVGSSFHTYSSTCAYVHMYREYIYIYAHIEYVYSIWAYIFPPLLFPSRFLVGDNPHHQWLRVYVCGPLFAPSNA